MKDTGKQRFKRLDAGTWRSLLDAQESSGLSIKSFCVEHEIKEASFYQWRKRLKSREAGIESFFRPIHIAPPLVELGIRLELPGGLVLNFSDLPPVGYLRAMSLEFGGL